MPNGTCRRETRGFTIIELLVVIGIIVVLLGILLPVVNAVRKSAQKADSSAEITKIATAIHNYYQDFRAFPGPLPDSEIYGFNALTTQTITPAITGLTGQVTSSQNLVMGLCGALSVSGSAGTPTFAYPPNASTPPGPGGLVTSGPQSLNLYSPQQYPPYFDAAPAELSNNGNSVYQSCANGIAGITAAKSPFAAIPEFLDHFSIPTPRSGGATSGNAIIYLRARLGAAGMVDNMTFPGGPTTAGTAATTSQYYSAEMSPYWVGGSNATPSKPTPGMPFPTQPDVNSGNTVLYTTAASFFYSQALNDGVTPRSKDTFILISAGYDGIYGTSDDIVYSN